MNAVAEKPAPAAPAAQSARVPPGAGPAAAPTRRARRRWLRPLAALVVLAGVAVTGAWWLEEGRWIESTDNAYVQGDIAVLSPRVEGQVQAIAVADNQPVRAGDTLIQLDPADYQARLDQARASAQEADAAVETATRQIAQQRATIEAAEAAIVQAQAEQTRTGADANRAATLAASGWTSKQANDLAIAESRKAAAALTSSVAQKVAAEQQLAVLQAQAVQATARAANARAAVTLAENALAYTTIKAPFDGVVGNRAAELGQRVAPGAQVIAVAPLRERLYVVANFKETQLRHMRRGMKVRLIPDIDPGAAVDGHVDSMAPATGALFSLLPPENATGNFTKIVQRVPVRVTLDGEDGVLGLLRPGLSVTARIDTRP